MRKHVFLYTAAIAALLLVMISLLLAACGNRRGQVSQLSLTPPATEQSVVEQQTDDDGVLPPVMALDGCVAVSRGVSEDEAITSPGWEAYINDQTGTNGTSELNVEVDGTALTLRAYTPGEFAYAVYGQRIEGTPKPLQTLIDCEVCAFGGGQDDDIPLSYFVGIADYSLGSWRWFGPFGEEDVMVTVNSETLKSRFKSPADNFYLCVLASNGGKAASALPDEGLVADFPIERPARAVSNDDDDDDPGGLTIEQICTWVEENLLTDPAIVTGLQAIADTSGVHLTWDTNLDPDVFVYQVLRDDLDDEEPAIILHGVLSQQDLEYTDDSCIPGKEYEFGVRARNDAGFGGKTIVNEARLLEGPLIWSCYAYQDDIEISWTSVEGAIGYELYRGETSVEEEAELLVELSAQTTSHWDNVPPVPATFWYWVKALGEDIEGPLGPPETVTVDVPAIGPITPTAGIPGIEVTFSAEILGTPPFTYSWDFGSGADPNTSDEKLPIATLDSTDTYEASLTVTNLYGEDALDFTLTVHEPGPGDWWMFGREATHNRRSPYVGAQTDNLKWRYATEDTVNSSPAIGVDGTIYVGSGDGYLYAITSYGTLRWKYAMGSDVLSSPAIGSDGTVYVGSDDSYIYAITPYGDLKWRYVTGDSVYSSPTIGIDGTIYVGSDDGYLYALTDDEIEATLNWTYPTGDRIISCAAIGADGAIYVTSWDNHLYALNPGGTLKWSYQMGDYMGDWLYSSPAIGADGTIYLGSFDDHIYAITDNETEGTREWRWETGGNVFASPAIGADGMIYVGSLDKCFYARNPEGTAGYILEATHTWYSSAAIGADGLLYVGSTSGDLIVFSPELSVEWTYDTGSVSMWSSPAIGADGTIYVGCGDHYLYAFGD